LKLLLKDTALFLTADDLMTECRKANEKGTLQRLVNRWSPPDVLIIDEVGYFPFDELTAMCFFKSYRNDMKMER